jgi:peptide/nickel transport system permease protein
VVAALLGPAAFLAVLPVLVFGATELLPGDAVTARLGASASPTAVAAYRAELGLDDPAPIRFGRWAAGALTGDLGRSLVSGRPVAELIGRPLRNSAILAACTTILVVVVSLPAGIWLGVRAGSRADAAGSAAALVLVSIPDFVVAAASVAVFAWAAGWLPPVSPVPAGSTPLDRPAVLVLPILSAAVAAVGWATRWVRAAVAAEAGAPHVEAARLAGVGPVRLAAHHLLPGALPAVAQAYALLATYLAGGVVVVERAFGYPGAGTLLTEAVRNRDLPVVQGLALIMSAVVAAAFLAADAANAWRTSASSVAP